MLEWIDLSTHFRIRNHPYSDKDHKSIRVLNEHADDQYLEDYDTTLHNEPAILTIDHFKGHSRESDEFSSLHLQQILVFWRMQLSFVERVITIESILTKRKHIAEHEILLLRLFLLFLAICFYSIGLHASNGIQARWCFLSLEANSIETIAMKIRRQEKKWEKDYWEVTRRHHSARWTSPVRGV